MQVKVLGVERRRRWSCDEKVRLIEETLHAGETVSGIDRRRVLAASLLITWHQQARQSRLGSGDTSPWSTCHDACWWKHALDSGDITMTLSRGPSAEWSAGAVFRLEGVRRLNPFNAITSISQPLFNFAHCPNSQFGGIAKFAKLGLYRSLRISCRNRRRPYMIRKAFLPKSAKVKSY